MSTIARKPKAIVASQKIVTATAKLREAGIHLGLSSPVLKLAKLSAAEKLSTFEGLFCCLEYSMEMDHPPQDSSLKTLLQSPYERIIWYVEVSSIKDLTTLPTIFSSFLEQIQDVKREQLIVFTLQQDIHYSTEALNALLEIRDNLSFPCILESTHRSWKTANAQMHLSNAKMIQAAVDAPKLYGIIKDIDHVSPVRSYLRLLGRNSRNWFEPVPQKYEYQYSTTELQEIAQRIYQLRQASDEVLVIFSIHPLSIARTNALGLVQHLAPLFD